MKKAVKILLGIFILVFISTVLVMAGSGFKIVRHPSPDDWGRGVIKTFPAKAQDSTFDLRCYDLTSLNLKDKMNDLLFCDFDSKTKWPASLPQGFNPAKIMELGKNPGLGIRSLHKKGITGKGIAIAIIDQTLLVDHVEYKDRLKLYEEIPAQKDWNAAMHGGALASIAVGKTVGVAPGADLYYIAAQFIGRDYTLGKGFKGRDFTWVAKSIDRVIEINKKLSKDKKIRVIAIAAGWDKNEDGYKEIVAAVEKAKKEGIFVVSSSINETYAGDKIAFNGLGRLPMNDPEKAASYAPGLWWADGFFKTGKMFFDYKCLLVPMDSRCTASPNGNKDYVFYRSGGWSWSIPYIAGLYALACQAKPNITPQEFWGKALKTGDAITLKNNGKNINFEVIVNPVKLIKDIQDNK